MSEIELVEKAALKAGMKSLLNHGAASMVYTEGIQGVSQDQLVAFAREIAVHCIFAAKLEYDDLLALSLNLDKPEAP